MLNCAKDHTMGDSKAPVVLRDPLTTLVGQATLEVQSYP
jgi:hypothetical protein